MKRKFITLEIYASDLDMKKTERYINDLLKDINDHNLVIDGDLEVKIRENYISLHRQLSKIKNKEIE